MTPEELARSHAEESASGPEDPASEMGKMAAAVSSVATLATEPGEDAFRKLFRFYRQSRLGTADLGGVVDFSAAHAGCSTAPGSQKVVRSQLNVSSVSEHDAHRAGLKPVSKWQAYGLKDYPGFIFIPNPFLPGYQWHWVKQCLKLYSQKPNVCNLDKHMTKEEPQDLWEQSKEFLRCKEVNKRRPRSLLEKLRWVTLGYHYDWDSKKYSADHYTPFPSDLAFLSEQVAAACGFQGFRAEAGILNYYYLDSTLGIHVDRSELDHSRPLLSFRMKCWRILPQITTPGDDRCGAGLPPLFQRLLSSTHWTKPPSAPMSSLPLVTSGALLKVGDEGAVQRPVTQVAKELIKTETSSKQSLIITLDDSRRDKGRLVHRC
ncbi:nucleic acid dioxygenase ALKBH1 isoform X3 [Heterocephalus glaber]|uniref:Nucleic acid dioxygenase ALKBH1 isoform X3 n=1 Tax=Heterocephalus glaber TaxID=10181 RepID=A0AAX6RXT2_HETGA|nr:nucleic acid dioxygenase ALKBH1 isoform X3 [Heterocephalus glaber]